MPKQKYEVYDDEHDDGKRVRGWCITLNNYTEEELQTRDSLRDNPKIKYGIIGQEVCPTTGTPHLQGFLYFHDVTAFRQVKAIFRRAHLEQFRGTVEQNEKYCKKEHNFIEWGTKPMSQEEKGNAGKKAIAERWALAKAGRFEELPPEQIKTYEYIYRKSLEVHDRPTLDNIWIWGSSGVGKSSWVRNTYPVFYTKGMNKWWDGYNGEDVVVLDDFDPSHAQYLSYYLKIWCDHYVFHAEVKGGTMRIRPKTVIVTSQYPIEVCFPDMETCSAISRRFNVMNMVKNDHAH